MSQHFLLSAKARTLSVAKVARMSEGEATAAFRAIRWANTEGEPVCPRCGSWACYEYKSRPIFKCKACGHQFSVTSGTIFASRKLPVRDYLLAVALFVNGAKGMPALQLSRNMDVQYKTAYVMLHKIREAMAAEQNGAKLNGTVEIDGAYFGGYVKPENVKAERKDLRLAEHQTGKRKVVVTMRERNGRTLADVFDHESDSVPTVHASMATGTVVHADESSSWDALHAYYDVKRVNHSIRFYDDGVCTNQAESYFSRLRRAEVGVHHRISGKHLGCYAREMAWRDDYRREPNGTQFVIAALAAAQHPVSRNCIGYWQRNLSQ